MGLSLGWGGGRARVKPKLEPIFPRGGPGFLAAFAGIDQAVLPAGAQGLEERIRTAQESPRAGYGPTAA